MHEVISETVVIIDQKQHADGLSRFPGNEFFWLPHCWSGYTCSGLRPRVKRAQYRENDLEAIGSTRVVRGLITGLITGAFVMALLLAIFSLSLPMPERTKTASS